jgi:hypothetical protein
MSQLNLFATDYRRAIPIGKPTAPFSPGSPTSQVAAAAIAGDAKYIRQRVFNFIRSCREYGATDPEIAQALQLSSDTARPRRVDLRNADMIVDSGRTRPTQSGRPATVWIVSPKIGFFHE